MILSPWISTTLWQERHCISQERLRVCARPLIRNSQRVFMVNIFHRRAATAVVIALTDVTEAAMEMESAHAGMTATADAVNNIA